MLLQKNRHMNTQLELSETFVDTAFFNTTGGSANNFNHLEDCGSTFGTLLPFRVKNLTTGNYVKVSRLTMVFGMMLQLRFPLGLQHRKIIQLIQVQRIVFGLLESG